jgi:hypothetical protein
MALFLPLVAEGSNLRRLLVSGTNGKIVQWDFSLITTDACRCCAGTYSPVVEATACVTCDAGESTMPQAPHVMTAYPIIYIFLLLIYSCFTYICIYVYFTYICLSIYLPIYLYYIYIYSLLLPALFLLYI